MDKDALLLVEYQERLESYRHHSQLYLRVAALHLALLAAITAVIFQNTESAMSMPLILFVFFMSALGISGTTFSIKWINQHQERVIEIAGELGIQGEDHWLGRAILWLAIIGDIAVVIAYIFVLFYVS